jgi:hypothetical protein
MRIRSLGASALIVGLCIGVGSMSSFAAKPRTARGVLVHKIVSKWGAHVQEAYKADIGEWARAMTPLMIQADLTTLRKASDARTFEGMNNALLGEAAAMPASFNKLTTGTSLGSPVEDLVLVPVQPCRLFDTRLVGGAIAANSWRGFDVSDNTDFSYQGGASNDCGVGSVGPFAAAVINFTVVSPAAGGYITAYPYMTSRPVAATVNFAKGETRGNLTIVKLDQSPEPFEVAVYAYSQTHVVADIVGYFIAPLPTALDCVDTPNVSLMAIPGASAYLTAENCPAGYTMTSTNCESYSPDMPILANKLGSCFAANKGSTTAELQASRTCCRVPGR